MSRYTGYSWFKDQNGVIYRVWYNSQDSLIEPYYESMNRVSILEGIKWHNNHGKQD